jgi:hypothetical protein
MKLKLNIKKEVELQPDALEEKINIYLKKNFYRVIERGPGFIIFKDDEYSDRRRSSSDHYTRLEEGKFIFHPNDQGTSAKLIYFTSILYPAFLMMLLIAFGLYVKTSVMPIVFSFVFALPVLFKIYYLQGNVFHEILQC